MKKWYVEFIDIKGNILQRGLLYGNENNVLNICYKMSLHYNIPFSKHTVLIMEE